MESIFDNLIEKAKETIKQDDDRSMFAFYDNGETTKTCIIGKSKSLLNVLTNICLKDENFKTLLAVAVQTANEAEEVAKRVAAVKSEVEPSETEEQ